MCNQRIIVVVPKPRGKQVNDVLRTKRGGPMRSIKDYIRAVEKQKVREELRQE